MTLRTTPRPASALLASGLALAFAASAAAENVLSVDFTTRGERIESVVKDPDDGHAPHGGAYVELAGNGEKPQFDLASPVGPAFTVAAWVRADEWPEGTDANGFGPEAPATILALMADGKPHVMLRVRKGLPELNVRIAEGRNGDITGTEPLPAGEWLHLAATHDGRTAKLYVDGQQVAEQRLLPPGDKPVKAFAGHFGPRRHVGDLDDVNVFDEALDAAAVAELAGAEPPEAEEDSEPAAWAPKPLEHKYAGRELRMADGATLPLAEGLAGQAAFVPLTAPGAHDALVRSFGFNPSLLLHSDLRREGDGRWVYHERQELADTAWGGQLGGGPFWRVPRQDGRFDLLTLGTSTGLGDGDLVVFPADGTTDAPAFGDPYVVAFDGGYPFAAVAPETPGKPVPSDVVDIDGDGVQDLLFVVREGMSYPDGKRNFWTHEQTRYAGPGRTYAVNGTYLGGQQRTEVFWARGQRGDDGRLAFGGRLPVHQGRADFPLVWKGPLDARAAVMSIAGERFIVMVGSLDQVLAMPMTVEGDVVRAGEPAPLLAGGADLEHVYIPHHLTPEDLDGDGTDELMVCGNPGSAVILSGTAVGDFAESRVHGTGGPLRMQTLVVPQRIEVTGDDHPDVVMGDASGYVLAFPGTDDPRVYDTPRPLIVNGEPFHYRTAPSASIQGPDEDNWAYINPLLHDLDGDGTLDLLFGETGPQLNFARGTGDLTFDAPRPFTRGGDVWQVAWRQRPAVTPDGRLLVQDWDGDLALATPDSSDVTRITGVAKLTYADEAAAIRTSGPGGFWGRGKPVVTDWDGDGDWDVLFGTHRGNLRYVDPAIGDAEGARIVLLDNAGTNAEPAFARPTLLSMDGTPLTFGTHVAAAWPSDLDADGRADLIVGTDDGRVYAFVRGELSAD